MLKDQQAEMEQLSFLLYTQGLTTEQIGGVFEHFYSHHYAKQSIARLAQRAHQEVLDWLDRPLDPSDPIVYMDCIFVPLRRGSTGVGKLSIRSWPSKQTRSGNPQTLMANGLGCPPMDACLRRQAPE